MRDIFLCHASEEKESVTRPLAEALEKEGISYWLDEAEIMWGDDIVKKVNEGLSMSRFVIVILSQNFLRKPWPEKELNSALNIEASSGEVKVLPLIVGDTNIKAEILRTYPLLNAKAYLTWNGKIEPVIGALKKRLSIAEKPPDTDDKATDIPVKADNKVYIPKVRKKFTQREKDLFLKDSFHTIKSYFNDALPKLESRYKEIDTDFMEVNKLKFTSKIYVDGELRCQCKIWIGGSGSTESIGYFEGAIDIGYDNSYNEQITVEDDGSSLYLRFLMGQALGTVQKKDLSPEEAAEGLWKRFTFPLER